MQLLDLGNSFTAILGTLNGYKLVYLSFSVNSFNKYSVQAFLAFHCGLRLLSLNPKELFGLNWPPVSNILYITFHNLEAGLFIYLFLFSAWHLQRLYNHRYTNLAVLLMWPNIVLSF